VKYPDGSIRQVYLPCDDDAQLHLYYEVVPGTHTTASLLSYLLFNHYQMCSPDYRESKSRLSDMEAYLPSELGQLGWQRCRSTQQADFCIEEHRFRVWG